MLKLLNNKVFRLLSWLKHLKTGGFKRDTWYFIFDHGIGDTYMACALLPYLLEKGDKVSVFIKSKNQRFIPGLFSSDIEVLHSLKVEEDLSIEFAMPDKGHPLHLHPYSMFNTRLVNILGYKKISVVDTYKFMLGLDMHTKPKRPILRIDARQEAERIFDDYQLVRGKTVIICPRANSVVELSNEVWLGMADDLAATGLLPVFMNSDAGGSKYNTVEFPLSCAIEFCDLAGYMVSLRSGFCDLTATSSSRRLIIYPDEMWYGGKLIVGCGLINCELSDGKNLLEVVHDFNQPLASLYSKINTFFNEQS